MLMIDLAILKLSPSYSPILFLFLVLIFLCHKKFIHLSRIGLNINICPITILTGYKCIMDVPSWHM
jgi:hypothetical protein